MKKGRLLNSGISKVISEMGHTDSLVICDAGLPIPLGVHRIDLAVEQGLPSFLQVLDAVLSELAVESVVIAEEIHSQNPATYEGILEVFHSHGISPAVTEVSHSEFKAHTTHSRAIIRTGECTPFANIILRSGVTF